MIEWTTNEVVLDIETKSNDNNNMVIVAAIWMGFLVGMGSQSMRLKHECVNNGKEYACKAQEQLHTFKDVPESNKE